MSPKIAELFEESTSATIDRSPEFAWSNRAVVHAGEITLTLQRLFENKISDLDLAGRDLQMALVALGPEMNAEADTSILSIGTAIHAIKSGVDDLFELAVVLIDGMSDESVLLSTKELQKSKLQTAKQDFAPDLYLDTLTNTIDRSITALTSLSEINESMKQAPVPVTPAFEMVDINVVLKAAVANAKQDIGEVANFLTDYSNLPKIACSGEQIGQIFFDLIVNAGKAIEMVTRRNGRPGVISIRTKCNGDAVIAEIGDTGLGIPDSKQSLVFEPDFMTKEAGSGEGLALARHIVEEIHSGLLTFVTAENLGTTFFVRLPIRQSARLAA